MSARKVYEIDVTARGRALIVAETKAEARRKADAGIFDTVHFGPPSPQVSTIKERGPVR